MLAEDDPRWSKLTGGYRMPLDPRPLIERLIVKESKDNWRELWEEFHHQGDVGDASYAAVPLLVEAHLNGHIRQWDTYAMVAIIDLARTETRNPELPSWLSNGYFTAIQTLANMGLREIIDYKDPDAVSSILSIVALSKGLRTHASFLIRFSAEELQEIEWRAFQ